MREGKEVKDEYRFHNDPFESDKLTSIDRTLFEFHDVLSQSSGLVTEDVLDLTKIVRDVPSLWYTRVVQRSVVHVDVLINEEGLNGLDDFDRDVERDWNDVLEYDETRSVKKKKGRRSVNLVRNQSSSQKREYSPENDESVQNVRIAISHIWFIEFSTSIGLIVPKATNDGTSDTHGQQHEEVHQDVEIGFLFNL